MLTEICKELKNWFIKSHDDIKIGVFEISGGVITPSTGLQENQYYRIVGSIFNDGVHKYGDEKDILIDEKFDGTIWHMYVPADVIALASEIDEFQTNYGKVSPFSSESFGGYSYSKQFTGWKDAFADKLKQWRKI